MPMTRAQGLPQVLFPPERLAKVDGVSSSKVYLAVLGTMFDVTKGRAHYGALSTTLRFVLIAVLKHVVAAVRGLLLTLAGLTRLPTAVPPVSSGQIAMI